MRLLIGMSLLLLPLLVALTATFVSLHQVRGALEEIMEEVFQEVAPVGEVQKEVLRASVSIHDHLFFRQVFEQRDLTGQLQTVEEVFRAVSGKPFESSKERELLESAYGHWRRAVAIAERLSGGGWRGPESLSPLDMENFDTEIEAAVRLLEEVRQEGYREIHEETRSALGVGRRTVFFSAWIFALGLLATALAAIVISRSILKSVRALERGALRLGEEDLSYRVSIRSKDELGKLGEAFNIMANRLEQSHRELKDLSTRDYLTGLGNPRDFYQGLTEEVQRAKRYDRPLSLLVIDADHFKNINDSFGHPAGDRVLQEIAGRLRSLARTGDRVARIGGEEFGIILPETGAEAAFRMAERIRGAIEGGSIHLAGDFELKCTVSIGVAAFPEDADTEGDLFARADQALYAAKKAGRNQVRLASEAALKPTTDQNP